MGEESLLGKFYVYRDEDRDAVAVAQWAKGPSGGMMGQTFCRMGVPYGTTTQEDINNRAEFIVKACNAYADIAAKDAELRALSAQNEWLKARLAFLQLPQNQSHRREEWLVECGMPAGGEDGRV